MRESLKNTLLVIASILVALIAGEIGTRASTWVYLFTWPNFVLDARTVLARQDSGRYVHDDQVGYVPRAGYAAPGLTIDPDGLRHTGEHTADAPILAVGDSFTFGDEVNDAQTWPAQLQLLTGRRVLNGGVSGYGFDQTVLRAEQLAPRYKPSAIVVSFIADDIRRTEMRRLWSADKPWFELDKDQLVLRGVPVPPRTDPRDTLTFWQRTLGYSYLFDFILRRLDLLYDWFGDHIRVHPAGTGETLACRLTERLAALQRSSGAPGRGGGRIRSRGVGRSQIHRRAAPHDQGPARLRREERPFNHRHLRRARRDAQPAPALRPVAHERTRQPPDREAGRDEAQMIFAAALIVFRTASLRLAHDHDASGTLAVRRA